MKSAILLLSVLVFPGLALSHPCNPEQVDDDAKKAVQAANTGQPVVVTSCMMKPASVESKATVVRKVPTPMPPKTPSTKVDQERIVSTVISPIIIVTGAPHESLKTNEPVSRKEKIACEPTIKVEKKIVKQVIRVKEEKKRNIISFSAGMGPTKVVTSIDETEARVSSQLGGVFGLQYQRRFDNNLVLGASFISNTTVNVSAGLEF